MLFFAPLATQNMEGDFSMDMMPWLKADLLSGFSDLLESDKLADADLHRSAATLGSSDIFGAPVPAPHVDLSTDQVNTSLEGCASD